MKLTVLEYQRIYIGKERDLNKIQVSYEDAEAIRKIDLNNKGIFRWGSNFFTPKQWVGVISLHNLTIEILPKIVDSYDKMYIKKALLYMIKVANDIPTKSKIKAEVEFIKKGLLEVLISNYLDHLELYIKEGIVHSYSKVINNLTSIKGKIDLSKQIKKNILNPTKFVCKYSRLETNNFINELIKYTILKMLHISNDNNNIKRIKKINRYFSNVSQVSKDKLNKYKIHINKVNKHARMLINYSYLFLEGYSISMNYGQNVVASMLFDMNKVFERFIYKYYKKIYRNRVQYQNSDSYLIQESKSKVKKINLRPDLLIFSPLGYKMVVDTKWKNTEKFAKESDIYQMNAYVSGIPGVELAVLMYPKTLETDFMVGDYEFCYSFGKKKLKIRTVDLSLIMNEADFMNHLKKIIQ